MVKPYYRCILALCLDVPVFPSADKIAVAAVARRGAEGSAARRCRPASGVDRRDHRIPPMQRSEPNGRSARPFSGSGDPRSLPRGAVQRRGDAASRGTRHARAARVGGITASRQCSAVQRSAAQCSAAQRAERAFG